MPCCPAPCRGWPPGPCWRQPQFEDVSTLAPPPFAGARGITVGDVDNDGWPDLFVTGDGGRASLLLDEAGYAVTWDGTDEIGRLAATGVYLVRLHAGGVDRTRKLTLIR